MPRKPLEPKTIALYARMLERGFDGSPSLISLRRDVTGWTNGCRKLLRAAVRWKLQDGADRVLQAIPLDYEEKKEVVAPGEEDALAYEREAWTLPKRKACLAILPLATGLRAAETLGLPRGAIEQAIKTGQLVVKRKGGKEKVLDATHVKEVLKILLTQKRPDGKPWQALGEILSLGAAGTRYQMFHRLVRRVGRLAGLENVHPHLLRHVYATRLMADGASIRDIQEALGHVDIKTTQRYVHSDARRVAKFNRPFVPPASP